MKPLSPVLRSLLTLVVVIVLLAGYLLVRGLIAAGVFASAGQAHFAGRCVAVSGIVGAEDIAIDRPDHIAFLSAADRRRPSGRDGLYAMNLDGPAHLVRLSGTPADFHPGGISLYRTPDGEVTLMAIDRHGDGRFGIDIFAVTVAGGAAKLAMRAAVTGGLLVHPNDIAAVSPNAFYVTNDSTVENPALRTLSDYALLRRADVVYFNGMMFREVARGLNFANGIQVSPDGSHVYVAATLGRTLYTYVREPFSGALTQVDSLSIASGLDNIDIDGKGNLWVAGHPSLLAQNAYRDDPSKPSASQIFKVTVDNGVPASAAPVYVDNGGQIGDASVGAIIGKRLLIGSPLDDKILDCHLN